MLDMLRRPNLDGFILRFRMLMIAAGYEDGIDAGELHADPVVKMALERLPGSGTCARSPLSVAW